MDFRANEAPQSPVELAELLCRTFPPFRREWEDDINPVVTLTGSFSYHGVMLAFTDFLSLAAGQVTPAQWRDLAALLNVAVLDDGPLESAVSTCLLEHLHQLGLESVLWPLLSPAAREKTRA